MNWREERKLLNGYLAKKNLVPAASRNITGQVKRNIRKRRAAKASVRWRKTHRRQYRKSQRIQCCNRREARKQKHPMGIRMWTKSLLKLNQLANAICH